MVIDSTDKLRFAVVKVRQEALVTAQYFWGLQHRCVRHWNQLFVQDELDTMLADPRITEKKMPILCDSQHSDQELSLQSAATMPSCAS